MQIKELLNYLGIKNDSEITISDIVTSTKDVIDKCVLILVKGNNFNPILLIDNEIRKKCCAILTDEKVDGCFYIENLKQRVFEILDYFYFKKEHNFKIIGITGSEGKSSLASIIHQSLLINHKKALLISNDKYGSNIYFSTLTTPSCKDIIDAMRYCKDNKFQYLVMEVSSIGIEENRVDYTIFDYLFLTNLESDHLDYHHNIYQYHLSKIKLFQKNIKAKKFIFLTTYQKYPHLFSKITNKIIIDESLIHQKRNSLTHQVFSYKDKEYYSHLIFSQNRKNIVLLIEFLQTIKIKNIDYVIKKLKRVKGRLDLIHSRPYIMIDYAHSKNSVENVLKELFSFKQNRLIVVIGAGGDRDKTKRIEYGKSCDKYGDIVFVTNDNPRKEDPYVIAKMIIPYNSNKFIIELNRKIAIQKAIKEAKVDDIVVILGRGNEEYQIIKDKRIQLNDYEEVKKCLMN